MTEKEIIKAMNDAVLVRVNDWRCARAYVIQKILNDGQVVLRRANIMIDGQMVLTDETMPANSDQLEKFKLEF